MSLYESTDFSGEISLKDLFQTPEQIAGENSLDLDRLAYLVYRGGWPRATDWDGEAALEQAFDYYDAVVKSDISRVDDTARNPASSTLNFSDASSVSSYAKDAMLWAVENGIMQGNNGKLNPRGNATRAEAAQMLMQYFNNN